MGRGNPYVGDARTKEARKRGYPARSVFKLEELDRRFRLLRRGATVLDLGCAPGSWSLFASRRVGPGGTVLGIDLQVCRIGGPAQLRLVQGDGTALDGERLAAWTAGRCPPFDLLLSDMAPQTIGIRAADHAASVELCEGALAVARTWLRPGGAMAVKAFEGPELKRFELEMRTSFGSVKRLKPKGTRARSVELFLVGLGRKD
ncbi:MAG: RlmE family RNA methyltransferase [Myxococcota bacterium]|nr:RlmE family RNA methyltransferase [Myxococcota bacterium]